jgi:hypothetical protein
VAIDLRGLPSGDPDLAAALEAAVSPAIAAPVQGMEVLHADGAPFHGIGIVPDVEVTLDAAAFRDGIDPELEAAIAALP